MNKTSYTNMAKVWEYVEDRAFSRQSTDLHEVRTAVEREGMPQGSAAQAELLSLLVHLVNASSIIAIGTASVVEALQLIDGLEGRGQLTAVDSSTDGIALIRKLFAGLSDRTQTTLRAVNAPVGTYLPRLNAGDYDLIVVSGDASNYAPAFEHASRVLGDHGVIVFTDVMALDDPHANGGVINPADRGDKAVAMRELLDTVQSDERFLSTLTPSGTGLLIAVKR